MASARPTSITSWSELQREAETIVERLNADQQLALAAAANPLLALAELGYHVEPGARAEIEERLRFKPDDAERLAQLRRRVVKEAGGPFDLTDDEEVRRVLTSIGVRATPAGAVAPRPFPSRLPGRRAAAASEPPRWTDPFEGVRDAHALMEPLLAYRALDATEPRLADRDVYRAVRAGTRAVPVTRLRLRVKREREG